MESLPFTHAAWTGRPVGLAAAAEVINLPGILNNTFQQLLQRRGQAGGTLRQIRFETELPAAARERIGDSPEGYSLTVSKEEAVVAGRTEAARFYGAQTLLRLIDNGELEIGEACDVPADSIRGFKIYLPSPDEAGCREFRKLVDFICRYKFNLLVIEVGGAMEYQRHPEVNSGWIEYCRIMNEYSGRPLEIQNSCDWPKNSIHSTNGGGRVMPQAMLRELLDYCRERFIEVVPEMPSLSHCDYLLTRHPELAERPADPFPDTMCPNHPDYYPFLFDLFDEVIEVFRPKRMHIGHDEYYSIALCPRCRGRNAAELFAADLRKCSDHLKSRGVATMIWGDKLLNAHYPDGEPCGGAEGIHEPNPGKRIFLPATYPAIDQAPAGLQVMHWYWGVDRQLETEFTRRGMPMLFGNFSFRLAPEWQRRRQAANYLGNSVSNWGATDFRTMQRNVILFDLLCSAAIAWNPALDSSDYPVIRDWALRELYAARCHSVQGGCQLEVVHNCDGNREYHYFFDGWFVDEKADLLGHHCFQTASGRLLRLPVVYGSNIAVAGATLERGEVNHTGRREDVYQVDLRPLEASYETLPEIQPDGSLAYRCRYELESAETDLTYLGFEPVAGFGGTVSMLHWKPVTSAK